MDDRIDTAKLHKIANELMFSGEQISVQAIADKMLIEANEELSRQLEHWWITQESRVSFRRSISPNNRPDVPETVYQSVQLMWENALEDELYLSKAQLEAIEGSNQRLRVQLSESQNNVKKLEAERAMLRSNLQSSETNVSSMNHKVSEANAEMQRAQTSSEEAKKQLDKRMKEEVSRHQASMSKLETKISYYRHQLDKLRDDFNKKEVALNAQVQDLQGTVARSAVTHDTQFSQIRSQEEELRKYRGEITSQSRHMSQSNSQALASTNRLKRLEDGLQQREVDIKELKKRTILDKSDASRREKDLRKLIKSREVESGAVSNKLNELQRTIIAREEEIRRLTAKL
jgi:chromosome segregation ATPase